jgi:DNA polymerase/3'-5' exonuclease PolX
MKRRYPYNEAIAVARALLMRLRPAVEAVTIVGSLRREKPDVGDAELLYIPKVGRARTPGELFESEGVNLAEQIIGELVRTNILSLRLSEDGKTCYGQKNKLLTHVDSGLPIDLFATTKTSWFNYLVCRTGPAELNQEIATRANNMGYRWNPYGPGFTPLSPVGDYRPFVVRSEEDVFRFVGLPYHEPKDR